MSAYQADSKSLTDLFNNFMNVVTNKFEDRDNLVRPEATTKLCLQSGILTANKTTATPGLNESIPNAMLIDQVTIPNNTTSSTIGGAVFIGPGTSGAIGNLEPGMSMRGQPFCSLPFFSSPDLVQSTIAVQTNQPLQQQMQQQSLQQQQPQQQRNSHNQQLQPQPQQQPISSFLSQQQQQQQPLTILQQLQQQPPIQQGQSLVFSSQVQQSRVKPLFIITQLQEFVKTNAACCLAENQIFKKFILEYPSQSENTFFKSVVITHFKHMLYNDHIDIHNLSLFDLFERVKNKKITLKASPFHTCSNEELNHSFCNNIYNLIKLKTVIKKTALFRSFLEMIHTDPVFLEALMLMIKELVIETLEVGGQENESMKNIIHHNWIEMKPEFITLLSNTLNKQIEVFYLLDNRGESMLYDKIKSRYNCENTKIRLVYWHSIKDRKSYYYPIVDEDEIELFQKLNEASVSTAIVNVPTTSTTELGPSIDAPIQSTFFQQQQQQQLPQSQQQLQQQQQLFQTQQQQQQIGKEPPSSFSNLSNGGSINNLVKSQAQGKLMLPGEISSGAFFFDGLNSSTNSRKQQLDLQVQQQQSQQEQQQMQQQMFQHYYQELEQIPIEQLPGSNDNQNTNKKLENGVVPNNFNIDNTNNNELAIGLKSSIGQNNKKACGVDGNSNSNNAAIEFGLQGSQPQNKSGVNTGIGQQQMELSSSPLQQQSGTLWNKPMLIGKVKDLMYTCSLHSQKLNDIKSQAVGQLQMIMQQKQMNVYLKENTVPKQYVVATTSNVLKGPQQQQQIMLGSIGSGIATISTTQAVVNDQIRAKLVPGSSAVVQQQQLQQPQQLQRMYMQGGNNFQIFQQTAIQQK